MWRNFDGRPYTREQFATYVSGLNFGKWVKFITLHNTAGPTLAQWLKGGTTPAQRIRNLQSYYENKKGWHAGPHLFIDPTYIWGFSELTETGVHASCFNSKSIGIEMVGDYHAESFTSGDGAKVRDNAVYALGILHIKLGLQPAPFELGKRGLHFHIDCHRDQHDCPGKNVSRADMVARVKAAIAELGGLPAPVPELSIPENCVILYPTPCVGTVDHDDLKLRALPSASSDILATLPEGLAIIITGEAMNGDTRWLKVEVQSIEKNGWVAAQFVHVRNGEGPAIVERPIPEDLLVVYAVSLTGTVKRDDLKLRSRPDAESAIIESLPVDTKCVALGGAMNDTTKWLKVNVVSSGQSGWVAARYVDLAEDSTPNAEDFVVRYSSRQTATVNRDDLKLRARPTAKSAVIASLSNMTRLVVHGELMNERTKWLKVNVVSTGQNGWVAARYVNMQDPPQATGKRFTNILATEFGGPGDEEESAYGGIVHPSRLEIALPFRFKGVRPRVRVHHGNRSVECEINDVGPWNKNDAYWAASDRPAAETQRRNRKRAENGRIPANEAGIDMTPAVFRALGIPSAGMARVDWEFVSQENMTSLDFHGEESR